MRILLVSKYFKPGTGIHTYTRALSEMLADAGHEVGYFFMSHPDHMDLPYSDYFVPQIDFEALRQKGGLKSLVTVASRAFYSFESVKNIKKVVRAFKPDVVHIQHLDANMSYSILPTLKSLGVPIVWTIHMFTPLCINSDFFDGRTRTVCTACKRRRFYQPILRRCKRGHLAPSLMGSLVQYFNYAFDFLRHVDMFVCPSTYVRNTLTDWGFDPGKLAHVPNYALMADEPPHFDNEGYGVFCGRLVRVKGVQLLLDVLTDLDFPFKFVGDGLERDHFIEVAAKRHLDHVTFTGLKTGQAYTEIVSKARFLVMPSICLETFGLVILDAFVLGKPVIGATVGGIPELIDDGQTGLLFDPQKKGDLHEKISLLANNPDMAIQMGKRARQKAEAYFTPDRHLESLLSLYRTVMGRRRR